MHRKRKVFLIFIFMLAIISCLLLFRFVRFVRSRTNNVEQLSTNDSPPFLLSNNDNNNNNLKRTTIPAAVDGSCTFLEDISLPCRMPINVSLLPPGTTVHCTPANVKTAVPFAVLICGSRTNCIAGIVTGGPALIAIHGGPGQSSGMLDGIAPVSQHLPLILYDQRHSGRSVTLPSPAGENIEETMLNYVQELSLVLKTFGVQEAHLLGHSFGASIAIDYAHLHPERVASLILLSPVVDGKWWQEDADFHRKYVQPFNTASDSIPDRGDKATSLELTFRWVLGPTYAHMGDMSKYLCNPSASVYQTIWGDEEDLPNGEVQEYTGRVEKLRDLVSGEYKMNVLLGCGLFDEAPPGRMMSLARTLRNAAPHSEVQRVPIIILPHSAHVPAQLDWQHYVRAVSSFVQSKQVVPIIQAAYTLPSAEQTIQHMQEELRQLEHSTSVASRSFPYLGRLLTLKQSPPNGLKQLEPEGMQDLLLSLSSLESHIDWDIVQAVVDVWYIASIIDPTRVNEMNLRPPDALFNALCDRLNGYKISTSPVDRIMYYVVGFGLQRLQVECAPIFEPYNWKEIANSGGMDMKQDYPVIYMYLLTHVYIYQTDFGTLKMTQVSESVRKEIEDAVLELIDMMPLALEPRSFQRVFNGMVAPEDTFDDNAMFDVVCEILFTVVRVHGKDHPVANALAVHVYEWMSKRSKYANDGDEHGHLLAVCVGAWQVWENSPTYI